MSSNDRTRIQRKTATGGTGANQTAQRAQEDSRIAGSPAMLAQRKQLASAFGGAAQLAGMDEEMQMKSPEEEMQMKSPDDELGA